MYVHEPESYRMNYHLRQTFAPFYFYNNFIKPLFILIIFGSHILKYISYHLLISYSF